MENILDPKAISEETINKVFDLDALGALIKVDPASDTSLFVNRLMANKEAMESFASMVQATMSAAKNAVDQGDKDLAIGRLNVSFITVCYFGYRLAQAQLEAQLAKSN